jgi:hypothetical protein
MEAINSAKRSFQSAVGEVRDLLVVRERGIQPLHKAINLQLFAYQGRTIIKNKHVGSAMPILREL